MTSITCLLAGLALLGANQDAGAVRVDFGAGLTVLEFVNLFAKDLLREPIQLDGALSVPARAR